MRRPLSLAQRLTLLFGIAAAVVFPIFGWVIIHSTERHFVEEDGDELVVVADAVQDLLLQTGSLNDLSMLNQRFADILVGHHDAALRVTASNNRLVYASQDSEFMAMIQESSESIALDSVRDWAAGDQSHRILIRSIDIAGPDGSESLDLVVAVPIDHHLRFLSEFRRTLWIMVAVSVAFLSLMGWIAVQQGHTPLHEIVARIRRISADDLNTRLNPKVVPAELVELAYSFNEMLESVDRAFQKLSEFNADIAHELRTPIANLMTQTQVGLSRVRSADEYREILYSSMEEYERMAQMVSDMLYLAKADSHARPLCASNVNLAMEIQALFEFYEGWAEDRGVSMTLDGEATIAGDRPMLQRALSNLISNAIKHTSEGGTVKVQLRETDKSAACVIIENPGADIPPEQLLRLFDRFYRVDQSRRNSDQGVGLGLAIVESIVNAHQGNIDVVSSSGVTRFTVSLPIGSVLSQTSQN